MAGEARKAKVQGYKYPSARQSAPPMKVLSRPLQAPWKPSARHRQPSPTQESTEPIRRYNEAQTPNHYTAFGARDPRNLGCGGGAIATPTPTCGIPTRLVRTVGTRYNLLRQSGRGADRLARYNGVVEVESSNLSAPTRHRTGDSGMLIRRACGVPSFCYHLQLAFAKTLCYIHNTRSYAAR